VVSTAFFPKGHGGGIAAALFSKGHGGRSSPTSHVRQFLITEGLHRGVDYFEFG